MIQARNAHLDLETLRITAYEYWLYAVGVV